MMRLFPFKTIFVMLSFLLMAVISAVPYAAQETMLNQSTKVDCVSGATMSSETIMQAIRNALDTSGGKEKN